MRRFLMEYYCLSDNGIETLVSELKHDKGNRYSTDIKC